MLRPILLAAAFASALAPLACREPPAPMPGATLHSAALDQDLRYVPAGSFRMGSPLDEPGRDEDETPHPVTLTRGIWLGETEVTQEQWARLTGTAPSFLAACGPHCPVESVSWTDAVAFANLASEAEGLQPCYQLAACEGTLGGGCPAGEDWCDGDFRCARVELTGLDCPGYRLPTEAEWERAARAGTETPTWAGGFEVVALNAAPALSPLAWYGGNSGVDYSPAWPCGDWGGKELPAERCGTHPVGAKEANPWGLRDMLGNVWEWTGDWHAPHGGEPATDPAGPATGEYRIRKGCSWSSIPRHCRAADRSDDLPTHRDRNWGLRLARTAVDREPAASLPAAGPARVGGDDEAIREAIRLRVEQLRAGHSLVLGGVPVVATLVLPELYETRAFEPLWTDASDREQLVRAIARAPEDGLEAETYHRDRILALRDRLVQLPEDAELHAELDLLLTDALVLLRHHLLFGKVDPVTLDPNWNLSAEPGDGDLVSAIEEALASGRLGEVVESYKPVSPYYVRLKEALRVHRGLVAAGGWPAVPEIRRLEPGVLDERVPALRRRLAASGDLPLSTALDSPDYDEELVAAVRHFQLLHGLTADGIVGPRTVGALNVSVERRLDQIRVNLERGRWILRDFGDDYVAVNIAGFWVYLVKNGRPVWTSRVVVGRTQHKSPVFRADLRYLVFNPTWTVPGGIARAEILPALRKDPDYLRANHMTLLDRDGREVDPSSIDLAPGAAFPYVVRQAPGPWNALGRVKFMFPNPYSVYLHDTPSRDLFARDVRTFSHGCIRVEDPLALAERLLAGQTGWDRARIDAVLARGETTTVTLDDPLPVLILYWTAWVNSQGELRFYDDVYGRDAAVLDALTDVEPAI